MLRPVLTMTLLLTLAACGSPPTDNGNGTDTGTPPEPPELATCPSTIIIDEFEYEPGDCQVAAGTTITFLNQDTVDHTATSLPGTPAAFDTGNIGVNKSKTVTFTASGVYDYFCTIHPDMEASITVK